MKLLKEKSSYYKLIRVDDAIVHSGSYLSVSGKSYQRTVESTNSYRNTCLPARVHGPLSKSILRRVSIRFRNSKAIVCPSSNGTLNPIRLELARLESMRLLLPSSLCGSSSRLARS